MRDVEVDGERAASGLMALVVTVVELLVEALEREAIRRMESGALTDEEIERLGTQLQEIEAEIERIKEREGIEDEVARLRGDLDSIVSESVEQVRTDARSVDPTRTSGVDRSGDTDRTRGVAPDGNTERDRDTKANDEEIDDRRSDPRARSR